MLLISFFPPGLYYFYIILAFSRYADALEGWDPTRLIEVINPGGEWPCSPWHAGQSFCASNYLNHEDIYMDVTWSFGSQSHLRDRKKQHAHLLGILKPYQGVKLSVLGSWRTKCPFGLVDPSTSYRQRSARWRGGQGSESGEKWQGSSFQECSCGGQPPSSPLCAAKSKEYAQRLQQPEQEVHTLILLNAALRTGIQPARDVQVFLWSPLLCQTLLEKEFLKQGFWTNGRIFTHIHL